MKMTTRCWLVALGPVWLAASALQAQTTNPGGRVHSDASKLTNEVPLVPVLGRSIANRPASSTNIVIRMTKSAYRVRENVELRVIERPATVAREEKQIFSDLVMGAGTIIVRSGGSGLYRLPMRPIQATRKDPEGLNFGHSIGLAGGRAVPNLTPGKYAVSIDLDGWHSNVEEFEILPEE